MTAEEKLAKILDWAKSVKFIEEKEDFDLCGWCGGNAYALGYEQADSDTAQYILGIIDDFGQ